MIPRISWFGLRIFDQFMLANIDLFSAYLHEMVRTFSLFGGGSWARINPHKPLGSLKSGRHSSKKNARFKS